MTRIDRDTGKKIGKLPDYSSLQYDEEFGADYDNRKPNVDVCCGVEEEPENPDIPYLLLKQGKTFVALVNNKEVTTPLASGSTSSAAPGSNVECGLLLWFGLQRPTSQPAPAFTGLKVVTRITPGIVAPALTRTFPLYDYTTPTWVDTNIMMGITIDWFCFSTRVTKFLYDYLQSGAVINSQLWGPAGAYGPTFLTNQTLNSGWADVTNGTFSTDIGKNALRTSFPDKFPTFAQEPGFYSLKTHFYGGTPGLPPGTNNPGTMVWWTGQPLDPPNIPTMFTAWALNPLPLGNSFAAGILTYNTGGVDFVGSYRDEWWMALNFDTANQPRLHLP